MSHIRNDEAIERNEAVDAIFLKRKIAALTKLQNLIYHLCKNANYLSPILEVLKLPEISRKAKLNKIIQILKLKINKNDKNKKQYERALVLVEDYLKIDNLIILDLPTANNKADRYCALSKTSHHSTNDLMLASLDDVTLTLYKIDKWVDEKNIDKYIQDKDQYQFIPEAILKLSRQQRFPGKIQREYVDFAISKIYGFSQKTDMAFIKYHGRGGLLITGDISLAKRDYKITELSIADEVAYTIKKLRHENNVDNFINELIIKHKQKIKELNQIKTDLNRNRKYISSPSTSKEELKKDIKNTKLLLRHAKNIQKEFLKHKEKLNRLLPQVNHQKVHFNAQPNENDNQIQTILSHAITIEKILNKPKLFNEKGKRHKYPKVTHKENIIKNIDIKNNDVMITFKQPINLSMIDARIIKYKPPADDNANFSESINISMNDLINIYEDVYFYLDSHQMKKNDDFDYLADLEVLKNSYRSGFRDDVVNIISHYKFLFNKNISFIDGLLKENNLDSAIKFTIETITNTLKQLNALITTVQKKNGNLGFIMHVKRNLQFDIHKRLQQLFADPVTADLVRKAFNAAIKLDRMDEFNHVMMHYLSKKITQTQAFTEYLHSTIEYAKAAVDDDQLIVQRKKMDHHSSLMFNEIYEKIVVQEFSKNPEGFQVQINHVWENLYRKAQKHARSVRNHAIPNTIKDISKEDEMFVYLQPSVINFKRNLNYDNYVSDYLKQEFQKLTDKESLFETILKSENAKDALKNLNEILYKIIFLYGVYPESERIINNWFYLKKNLENGSIPLFSDIRELLTNAHSVFNWLRNNIPNNLLSDVLGDAISDLAHQFEKFYPAFKPLTKCNLRVIPNAYKADFNQLKNSVKYFLIDPESPDYYEALKLSSSKNLSFDLELEAFRLKAFLFKDELNNFHVFLIKKIEKNISILKGVNISTLQFEKIEKQTIDLIRELNTSLYLIIGNRANDEVTPYRIALQNVKRIAQLEDIYHVIIVSEKNSKKIDLNKLTVEKLDFLNNTIHETLVSQPEDQLIEELNWIKTLFEATLKWINGDRGTVSLSSKMGQGIEQLRVNCADMLVSFGLLDKERADTELKQIKLILNYNSKDTHMTGIQNMRAILDEAKKHKESSIITLFKLQKCTLERTNLSWPLKLWSESYLISGHGREDWAKKLYARVNNLNWSDFISNAPTMNIDNKARARR